MKLSSIAFCNGSVEQIVDHQSKESILSSIRMLINMNPDKKTTRMMNNVKDISYIRNPHVMVVLTSGQKYWLYCTTIEHKSYCILIEKYIKPGYPYPKMILVNMQFNSVVYQNTLFDVEITTDRTMHHIMLVSDILILKNRDIRFWDPLKRFSSIHTIFDKQFHDNIIRQPCAIQIKKLFSTSQLLKMCTWAVTLPYVVRGIMFIPLQSKFQSRIWLDSKREMEKLGPLRNESNSKNNIAVHVDKVKRWFEELDTTIKKNQIWIFKLEKSSQNDIYNLFIKIDNVLIFYDIANIPNISWNKRIERYFRENKSSYVNVQCSYNLLFSKWSPVEISEEEITNINMADLEEKTESDIVTMAVDS